MEGKRGTDLYGNAKAEDALGKRDIRKSFQHEPIGKLVTENKFALPPGLPSPRYQLGNGAVLFTINNLSLTWPEQSRWDSSEGHGSAWGSGWLIGPLPPTELHPPTHTGDSSFSMLGFSRPMTTKEEENDH